MPSAAQLQEWKLAAKEAARHARRALAIAVGIAFVGARYSPWRKVALPFAPAPEEGAAPAAGAVAAAPMSDELMWVSLEARVEMLRGTSSARGRWRKFAGPRLGRASQRSRVVAAAQARPSEVEELRGREAASDGRLTPLVGLGGVREKKQWREVVRASGAMGFRDVAVPEPRTTMWCWTFLDRHAGGPRDQRGLWNAPNQLNDDMLEVAEHSLTTQAIDIVACYSGLDLVNFGRSERLFRKAQMIEYSYSGWGGALPPGDGQKGGEAAKEEKTSGVKGAARGSAAALRKMA